MLHRYDYEITFLVQKHVVTLMLCKKISFVAYLNEYLAYFQETSCKTSFWKQQTGCLATDVEPQFRLRDWLSGRLGCTLGCAQIMGGNQSTRGVPFDASGEGNCLQFF
jgi:hypothetical protein